MIWIFPCDIAVVDLTTKMLQIVLVVLIVVAIVVEVVERDSVACFSLSFFFQMEIGFHFSFLFISRIPEWIG